jgi:hypothetical protein
MAAGQQQTHYEFAESAVQAQVSSSQRATPGQIIKIAKKIWNAVAQSGIAPDDDEGNDKLLARLQAEYKDFMQSFPLVLRWMVQVRIFNEEALRKYLLRHAAAKLDSRAAFLELQADYLVLVYRETHVHPDEEYVKKFREHTIKTLLDEDNAFIAINKEAEAELAAQAMVLDQERRQKLYALLLARNVKKESTA